MSKTALQHHNICEKAISLRNSIETGFLELGAQLHEIKTNSLWRGVYASWDDFTVELKMSKNTINKLIQIHQVFMFDFGFDIKTIGTAGGFSLVSDILPACTDKEEATRWLLLAQTLTRSDLRKELKEAKTGISVATCQHKTFNTFEVCEDCGEHFFIKK